MVKNEVMKLFFIIVLIFVFLLADDLDIGILIICDVQVEVLIMNVDIEDGIIMIFVYLLCYDNNLIGIFYDCSG